MQPKSSILRFIYVFIKKILIFSTFAYLLERIVRLNISNTKYIFKIIFYHLGGRRLIPETKLPPAGWNFGWSPGIRPENLS